MTGSRHDAAGQGEEARGAEKTALVRVLACGSVDDGKSTLIGRLLAETHSVPEDQLAGLRTLSESRGFGADEIDYSLLLDGLEAEREQGITIDVAYRFFASRHRRFILADAPGHEEYTRNMATGASTADIAIVLVDARKGGVTQTRRHTFIAALLGVPHVILAVNKMDLVDFAEARFAAIVEDYRQAVESLGFRSVNAIPVAARSGDNLVVRSPAMPWYAGDTLLDHLEAVPLEAAVSDAPFRFPVQMVLRGEDGVRGFAGQVAAGRVAVGDAVVVAQSGRAARIRQIVTKDALLDEAREGQAVSLVLDEEVDASRGSMLVSPDARPQLADQLQAHVIWFGAEPMIPGRSYLLRTENDLVPATVTALRYELNINTLAHDAAKSLVMNRIGVCNLSLIRPIAFDPYRENRITGNFVLLDRFTNTTLGAGLIDFPLRRAANIHWQATSLTKRERSAVKGQKPAVLWFTGLSGSGKSTLANRVEAMLHAQGMHTYLLDGDNVRHGLNRDLGFTAEDRVENIRRVAEVARLMADAGLIVLVAFISPFAAERRMARDLMEEGEFIEIFVDTPIEECARRDPKGLYRKAAAGELRNFTGLDSPYERPLAPELRVETSGHDPQEGALQIVHYLLDRH
ncbi:adenylyl-sulfate kinase [Rhizobium sp. CSW-27]|uniref:adenylyl-sulfate kinase n=1 Tax=Rhizobium sp. CSW-27 TaxID=2839985 RepID=UPI001C033B11|nr:adenylyl-sulfate kinase [Rhizobium sp. CSW-27]MBT9371098.1 adenylyl-sulfate kinase [Rhizobium sp. CSW-27]